MGDNWARLGAALQAARKARGTNQVQMAELIGVGRSAIQNIERGNFKKITPTVRAYADLVGWTETSAEGVLAGGEPALRESAPDVAVGEPTAAARVERAGGVPLRIARALEEGAVLDAAVIPLSADSDSQMVIVVKGPSDGTPEQIKKALLLWEQREIQLRGLHDDDELPAAEEA